MSFLFGIVRVDHKTHSVSHTVACPRYPVKQLKILIILVFLTRPRGQATGRQLVKQVHATMPARNDGVVSTRVMPSRNYGKTEPCNSTAIFRLRFNP
ncbi:hypothetical protein [Rickettsia asembonensis]|uniref:hypothetical protein n=1 Tax=Rickettsia asembonensis TaxID=1068590 RepID=UPI0011BADBCE|nr:hypothetical protein [Rickettsia asembonensis]